MSAVAGTEPATSRAIDLVRPELLAMRGYSSARMEASGGRVWLNANESPWDDGGLQRYPEPQPAALRERLAERYGVPSDTVLVSRGSDEAIDLLTRAFCRAGRDAIIVSPPTFGMYAVCADIQGARVVRVPLEGEAFTYPFQRVLAAIDDTTKLVYVCSPNNPTGTGADRATILELARAVAGRALVVVDEAYVEFAGRASLAPEAAGGENLVVLRTLSKAYGLAGARIGALVGAPEIVALLRKIMPPYPLPTPSIEAALAALSPERMASFDARLGEVRSERTRVAAALRALDIVTQVLPSEANFVTARFRDGASAYRQCLARGIVVRDVSADPALANALRITVGLPDENDAMLAALAQLESAR